MANHIKERPQQGAQSPDQAKLPKRDRSQVDDQAGKTGSPLDKPSKAEGDVDSEKPKGELALGGQGMGQGRGMNPGEVHARKS